MKLQWLIDCAMLDLTSERRGELRELLNLAAISAANGEPSPYSAEEIDRAVLALDRVKAREVGVGLRSASQLSGGA